MNNKFSSMQKEIDKLNEEITLGNEQYKQTTHHKNALEKEIQGLRKEIKDRCNCL